MTTIHERYGFVIHYADGSSTCSGLSSFILESLRAALWRWDIRLEDLLGTERLVERIEIVAEDEDYEILRVIRTIHRHEFEQVLMEET